MDVRTSSARQNKAFKATKIVDAIGTASRHQSSKNEKITSTKHSLENHEKSKFSKQYNRISRTGTFFKDSLCKGS